MVNRLQFLAAFAHGAQRVDQALRIHFKKKMLVAGHVRHRVTTREVLGVTANETANLLVRRLLRLVQDLIDDRTWEPYRIHAAPHTGQAGSLRSLSSRHSIVSTSSSS